jgi:hypothetical protein
MSLTKLSLIFICVAAPVAYADDKAECVDSAGKAQDLRRDKQLILARESLLVCARETCPTVVKRDCVTWLQEVEAAQPTLVLSVKDASGADVVDARVLLDGKAFLERITGTAVTIDPGVHTLRIESSTAAPLEQQIVVREGEKNRLLELRVSANKAPEQPAVTPTVEPKPAPPEPQVTPPVDIVAVEPPVESTPTSRYRTIGIATGAVGAALVITGGVFGLKARSRWQDAQDACGAGCSTDSEAYKLRDDARSAATISTVAIIGGAVGVIAGVTLFVLGNRQDDDHTTTTAILRAAGNGVLGYEASF